MSGWKECTLGDVLELQRGFDLPIQDRKNGAFPIIASTGVNGYHNEFKVKAPGVVIGRSGSIGGGQYVKSDFWPLNTTLWVKDFKGNNPRYCYYLLKNIDFKQFNVGSGVPTLNRNHIHPLAIKAPTSIETQSQIANILGNLDDKIELNNQINETLETMAKAIFKEWFIDFGPVKAKAEGKKPFGMDDEIASLFPDTFEDSELGPIPKGWEVSPISTIADVNKNVLKKTDLLEVIEYIEISSVGNGVVNSSEQYERGTEPSRAKRKIAHGDTVLSTVRPERAAYFLAFEPNPSQIVSTGFAVFSAKHKESWAFLHSVLTRSEFFEELGRLADGGAYPAISPDVISSQKIVLPPNELIASFQKITSCLYELKYRLSKENKSLAISRDLLLPKLISGELQLSEVASD